MRTKRSVFSDDRNHSGGTRERWIPFKHFSFHKEEKLKIKTSPKPHTTSAMSAAPARTKVFFDITIDGADGL